MHFGVVAVVNCMIGLITPPYGMLLFVINGATGIPISDIVREVVPYLIALILALLLLILFPELTSGCRASSATRDESPQAHCRPT